MNSGPGPVALIGSGETSPSGGRIFERLARRYVPPLKIAILETPAGFELNSDAVAGRVAAYLQRRLANYSPELYVIPARNRGTSFSPDNSDLLAPLTQAQLIFMGPGSPTYAVRHLRDTLAWRALIARHRQGAAIVLASAAAIAAGFVALPVYEIYKVGQELHWYEGLDFFGDYGLKLAIISHWNNATGGEGLDTSRCYMGKSRFERLCTILPALTTILGIDEHTALMVDVQNGQAEVAGPGEVTVIPAKDAALRRDGCEQRFESRRHFPLTTLGPFHKPARDVDLPLELQALAAAQAVEVAPSKELMILVARREAARTARQWREADQLRAQIESLGWDVQDTHEGPRVVAR